MKRKNFLPGKYFTLIMLMCCCCLISSPHVLAQKQQPQQTEFELTSIYFEGNSSIESSKLSDVIVSRETPNWLFKLANKISESLGSKPQYFDSLKIPDDMKALNNYYKDNGFFEVKVKYRYETDRDDEEASLTYLISEGPRYRIDNYSYAGLDSLPKELMPKFADINSIDSSDFFQRDMVEENRQEIRTVLLNNGYMSVTLRRPDVYIDTLQDRVDVRVGFNTGRRYRISDVRVTKKGEGKDFVDDSLIIKITDIKRNRYYSMEEVDRAQVRLYNTNLFTSVLVNTVPEDTSGNYVPLNVSADIGPLHELSPELILNNQESAFNVGIGAQYSKKNFLGDARNFLLSSNFVIHDAIKVNYGNLPKFLALGDTTFLGYLDTRATVTQPYFFNRRISSTFEGYFTIDKQRQYKSTLYGGKISLDFELPRFVFLNSLVLYYNVERSIHDYQPGYLKTLFGTRQDITQVDSLVNRRVRKKDFTSVIGVDLSANRTDNLLFPTKGYTATLTLEEANSVPNLFARLSGISTNDNAQFYRIIAKATYYPKIYSSKNDAFGFKLRTGYVQAYTGEKNDIPFNKRFTAGGSNSVRGWNSRELTPRKAIDPGQLSSQDFLSYVIKNAPVGGTFLLEASVETRNRLIGPIGGVLFADFGNSWEGYKQFRIDEIAIAAGFGIRYYSPFAPIRLDFGFKAYDPTDDKTFFEKFRHSPFFRNVEIHVGIGEAF